VMRKQQAIMLSLYCHNYPEWYRRIEKTRGSVHFVTLVA
jgi:hypothetical protein